MADDNPGCQVANCQKPAEAARGAVKHVFEILGVNVDDPQQVEKFRRGLRCGEDIVMYSKRGKVAVLMSLIGLLTAYIGRALWGGH